MRKPGILFLLNSLTFITLFHAYLSDNFLLQSVYSSSHTNLPFSYKLVAGWATHEGSMILWIWALSLYLFVFSKKYRDSQIYQAVITIQSYIVSIFLLFTIYSSNPFALFILAPSEGGGLNPILQDTALMVHPPILYLGYVGTSICFSIAIAILLTGKSGKEEFQLLNFFLLLAFSFLTFGIALGGWWSYRELGWGGFWSWDPVENISLFPWLLILGAIHSSFLSIKKGKSQALSVGLSILGFVTATFGTFITRMGLTDSLHTFNTSTESGMYLLTVTSLLSLISAIIFIVKFRTLGKSGTSSNIDRDSRDYLMSAQSILCLGLFIVLFLATFAPKFSKTFGYDSVYIMQSFYNTVSGEVAGTLAVCVCLFITLKSKERYTKFIVLTLAAITLSLGNFVDILTASLSVSGMMTMLSTLSKHVKDLQQERSIRELFTTKRNAFFLTHFGFGLFLYAVAGFGSNSLEKKQYFQVGEHLTVKNHVIKLIDYSKINNDLFSGIRAAFTINGRAKLEPELRFYKHENALNAESDTFHHLLSDIQILITGIDETLGLAVEIYYRDKIQLIWLGLVLIILGTTHKLLIH
ncbi:cytochrome c biogenesis protein CcmF [Neorickettsia findlayensis]|uniref:Cytochrome c biogenesis protein CcmF n=2 Tax=Neorickettsia findlayensis TaxID=2686014 RepID=A0A6P1GB28_9RICK|nr:cytochrome c biogenesis protein CcmF [Neorickettsia findlayensis]